MRVCVGIDDEVKSGWVVGSEGDARGYRLHRHAHGECGETIYRVESQHRIAGTVAGITAHGGRRG